MLSGTYYHFRRLTGREALSATIAYLTANPQSLDDHRINGYLEPIINQIPAYWNEELGRDLGVFLAHLEQARVHEVSLAKKIVENLANLDRGAVALRSMLTTLTSTNARIMFTNQLISPLITPVAATWATQNARQYSADLSLWLPDGPARDILAPRPPGALEVQAAAAARHSEEQRQDEDRINSLRERHQNTIRSSEHLIPILDACQRIPEEHWPEISSEQRSKLNTFVNGAFKELDLAREIQWTSDHSWRWPRELQPLLNLTDFYGLRLADDVPIILSLRGWPEKAAINYCRIHGLSTEAQAELANLLNERSNDNITGNVITFLNEASYDTLQIMDLLKQLALDGNRTADLRLRALSRLTTSTSVDILIRLATDNDRRIATHAFRQLVKHQHQATIRRALATLTDEQLQAGEASCLEIPYLHESPLDWIRDISASFAINDLQKLRKRALTLTLRRVSASLILHIAAIDKHRAARIMRADLSAAPVQWRAELEREAQDLERSALIDSVQQTPFDLVIRKLKGATSMIRIKVWCEGKTDRLILRKLFNDLGATEIADSLSFVGGWPNLLAEEEPEHYLDGCRRAVVIMDGDVGRRLNKPNRPPTQEAKRITERFKGHPITLYVLKRYGIENYFPRHALEAAVNRDLSAFFPLPEEIAIEKHLVDPIPGCSLWNRIRGIGKRSFYGKHLTDRVAQMITISDIAGSDLAEIIHEIKRTGDEARHY